MLLPATFLIPYYSGLFGNPRPPNTTLHRLITNTNADQDIYCVRIWSGITLQHSQSTSYFNCSTLLQSFYLTHRHDWWFLLIVLVPPGASERLQAVSCYAATPCPAHTATCVILILVLAVGWWWGWSYRDPVSLGFTLEGAP